MRQATNLRPMNIVCTHCDAEHNLMVNPEDVISWQAGSYIQDAMPYLSAAERELLISRTCDSCWKSMYGEDE